ncbi:uncharacterized protein [Salminus brasiliensis]|uniref:uncharacterized protein isoform X1 n=1 Tax=Salminus brasiliensis TaxID=930266 RepID=UPI003B8324E7
MDTSSRGHILRQQIPRHRNTQPHRETKVPSDKRLPSHPQQHPKMNVPQPENRPTVSSMSSRKTQGIHSPSSRIGSHHTIESAMSSSSLTSPAHSSIPAELRLVLVGRTGAGKSATGNTILGAERFLSEVSMSSVTKECQMECGEVQGRSLALIDTPGWFDTSKEDTEVEQEVIRCMAMCSPGPHAFLLIIPIARFTDEQQRTVELILEAFQGNINDHTIIIFTHADQLKGKPIQKFISEQDVRIQSVVRQFGGRLLAFNNNDSENKDQVTELLKKLDELLVKNDYHHFTNQKIQIMDKVIEVLDQNKEALTAVAIKRAKQDVQNTGQRRRDSIAKALEEDRQAIQRCRLHIQDKISQIRGEFINEQESLYPDPHRLRRLKVALEKEKDSLRQLKEEDKKRIQKTEEELRELDLWVQEEEQKREEEEREKASDRSRWYKNPFYFKVLTYLVVFLGGAGIGCLPMLFSFMAPAAAPVGLMAKLTSLIGPELLTVLTAAITTAVRNAAPLLASQCSIQ